MLLVAGKWSEGFGNPHGDADRRPRPALPFGTGNWVAEDFGPRQGGLYLYATANRNPHLYCHQVDYTNSPHIIMQNDKVVSINNTTQIDLQGQVASESDGHRHISGTGGQLKLFGGE